MVGELYMKILDIVGTKNTGKTILVTKIVKELVKRGFKVGTVKHVHHGLDLEGKDTWKHKEAGAELVVAAGEETFFMLKDDLPLDKILTLTKYLKKVDYIIIEGYKNSNYAKISVTDFEDDLTIQKVNPFEIDQEKLESIVDLVEKRSFGLIPHMNCQECGYNSCVDMVKAVVKGETDEKTCVMKKEDKVELKVDGTEIPLNPFVQKFVENTVIGMINALKTSQIGDISDKTIELMIKNEDNR